MERDGTLTEDEKLTVIKALNVQLHHASPMMQTIASLREKYDLHMTAERYISDDAGFSAHDSSFIRH